MRDDPFPRVVPDTQNLGSRPHLAVRRVKQDVALERPRRLLAKPGSAQPLSQFGNILNPEFDLSLDTHVSSEYIRGGGKRFKRRKYTCEDIAPLR